VSSQRLAVLALDGMVDGLALVTLREIGGEFFEMHDKNGVT